MLECGSDTVVQIQCLDEKGFWTRESVFLVGTREEKAKAFLNKVFGKHAEIYTTSRKVYYVC